MMYKRSLLTTAFHQYDVQLMSLRLFSCVLYHMVNNAVDECILTLFMQPPNKDSL